MLRHTALWLLLTGIGPTFVIPAQAQQPPRVVAIGDVHGAYEPLVAILQAAGLIDSKLEWSGGNARLVVLGDMLDRGAGSRAALELTIKLREQAARAGGEAQLLLGNHEVMNLVGDLRYVAAADFAAYRAEESQAERAAALQRFRGATAARGRTETEIEAEFAARYPPGFFGHRAAFSPRGRFGAWLLERPVLATVENTAFVHGGLSAAVDGKTAADINRDYSAALREYLAAVDTLNAAGVLHTEDPFYEHAAIAARFVATNGAAIAEPVRRAAERVGTLLDSAPFRSDAVFWYRGTVTCSAASESARLAAELAVLGVDRLVVGHTPTPGSRVLSRFDGTVIRIDTGLVAAPSDGRPAAVVIRGGDVRALYLIPNEERPPQPQTRRVGVTVGDLGDDELEELLLHAPVTARTPQGDGTERWQLEQAGVRVTAIFRPAPRRGFAALPEAAAYRFDRLLELDLVPVAVRREFEGRVGSLQLDVAGLPDDARRVSLGPSAESWCPLGEQFNLLYAFDVLAGNPGRTPSQLRYVPEGWQAVATDNQRLFRLDTEPPAYLRAAPIKLPGRLAAQLKSLTAEQLAEHLADVLDERQRRAILVRRDQLLARAAAR